MEFSVFSWWLPYHHHYCLIVLSDYRFRFGYFLTNRSSPAGTTLAGLKNYVQVIGDPAFRGSIGVTIVFSVVRRGTGDGGWIAVAILMNQTFPGRGLRSYRHSYPFAFPTIVLVLSGLLMFNSQKAFSPI